MIRTAWVNADGTWHRVRYNTGKDFTKWSDLTACRTRVPAPDGPPNDNPPHWAVQCPECQSRAERERRMIDRLGSPRDGQGV
jgi:hypothetical protein